MKEEQSNPSNWSGTAHPSLRNMHCNGAWLISNIERLVLRRVNWSWTSITHKRATVQGGL